MFGLFYTLKIGTESVTVQRASLTM